MKKLVLFLSLITLRLYAFERPNFVELETSNSIDFTDSLRSYHVSPCSSWRYDPKVFGYTCSFPNSRITVPDAYDLVRVINTLTTRIEQLEREVEELKKK